MSTEMPIYCAFCRSNNLLRGDVVAENERGYLLRHHPDNGCYLIIPNRHVEQLVELDDDWWAGFKQLLPKIPNLAPDYNLSLNFGANAGQTVRHLHFWIIPRESDKPSSGKGLAKLINDANEE